MSSLDLIDDFPKHSQDAWREKVDAGLRGAPFESLIHRTEDGLARGPLMRASDLPEALAPLGRTDLPQLEGRNWHICAPVRDPDLAHANTQLLDDLKGGASALRIESSLKLVARSDLKRVLEGVYIDLVPLVIQAGQSNAALLNIATDIESLRSAHLWAGLCPRADEVLLKAAHKSAPKHWRLMGLTGADTHEAGGTDVQELMYISASLADAMRRYGPDTVAEHMVIEVVADRDTHLTIAKIRAARRLIGRIFQAYEIDTPKIPLTAVTSLRMMQTTDAWTNLLRVMSAGAGAVMGGADMITTRPFTDGLGHATPFAHRVARNMQLMMMEESRLGGVSDPAFGSYWHECLTEDLAQAAWRGFQTIERAGGIEVALDQGHFETAIAAAKQARSGRDDPILGVTLHPATDVKPPEVRDTGTPS